MKSRFSAKICALMLAGGTACVAVGVHAFPSHPVHHTQVRTAVPTYPVAPTPNGVWIQAPNGVPTQVHSAVFTIPTASAHTVIVPAVAGKTVEVIGIHFTNLVAAGTLSLETTTSNTVIDGPLALAANGQFALPPNYIGYFWNTAGDGLDGTVTGSSNTISGCVEYIQY